MRILIVEDSPLVQKMYGLAFSPRLHHLVTAVNGREALAMLDEASDPFELILLDLRMPDMNGVQFLAELERRRIRVPVILTTAEPPGSRFLQEAEAYQPAAIVHKPWRPNDLKELASQVLATYGA